MAPGFRHFPSLAGIGRRYSKYMARGGFWQRLRGAVGRFFGAEPSQTVPPAPVPEPPEPSYQVPEPVEAEDVYQQVPPEESGIPPGPEESAYVQLGRDEGVYHDPYAMTQLWYGWFATDISSDQRRNARDQYFRYTGEEDYEFDWDQWRDWYETVSG